MIISNDYHCYFESAAVVMRKDAKRLLDSQPLCLVTNPTTSVSAGASGASGASDARGGCAPLVFGGSNKEQVALKLEETAVGVEAICRPLCFLYAQDKAQPHEAGAQSDGGGAQSDGGGLGGCCGKDCQCNVCNARQALQVWEDWWDQRHPSQETLQGFLGTRVKVNLRQSRATFAQNTLIRVKPIQSNPY